MHLIDSDRINYIGVGALTPEVVSTLIDKPTQALDILIPRHTHRLLQPDQMSDTEKEIMAGGSRYIPMVDYDEIMGIKGWLYTGLSPKEVEFLLEFDISDPSAYQTRNLLVTTEQGLFPSILVARRRALGDVGLLQDPRAYQPYAPFSKDLQEGRQIALQVATDVRNLVLDRKVQQ